MDHPVLTSFMNRLGDDTREDFLKILEMVGASLPKDAILADMGGNPERVAEETLSPEAMRLAVIETFKSLVAMGLSKDHILEMLKSADFFRTNWAATKQIIHDYEEGVLVQ